MDFNVYDKLSNRVWLAILFLQCSTSYVVAINNTHTSRPLLHLDKMRDLMF